MDKTMPHNIEAEQSVLGAMFLSKYALQKCLENLSQEVFYSDAHAKIFNAISSLAEAGSAHKKWAVPHKPAYSLAHCGTAHSGQSL